MRLDLLEKMINTMDHLSRKMRAFKHHTVIGAWVFVETPNLTLNS